MREGLIRAAFCSVAIASLRCPILCWHNPSNTQSSACRRSFTNRSRAANARRGSFILRYELPSTSSALVLAPDGASPASADSASSTARYSFPCSQ